MGGCPCLAPLLFHDLIASMLVLVPGSTEILLKWASLPDPHTLSCGSTVVSGLPGLAPHILRPPLWLVNLTSSCLFPWSCSAPGLLHNPTKPNSYMQSTPGDISVILALGAIRARLLGHKGLKQSETVFRLPHPDMHREKTDTHPILLM